MSTVLAYKPVTARKAHRCGDCEGRIERGQRYQQQRIAGDGTVWTFRSHPACHHIALAIHRDAGLDWDEWPAPDEVRAFAAWLLGRIFR